MVKTFVVRRFGFGHFKGPVVAGPFATAAEAFAAVATIRHEFPRRTVPVGTTLHVERKEH